MHHHHLLLLHCRTKVLPNPSHFSLSGVISFLPATANALSFISPPYSLPAWAFLTVSHLPLRYSLLSISCHFHP